MSTWQRLLWFLWLPLSLLFWGCCSLYFAPQPQGLHVVGGPYEDVAGVVELFAERFPGFDPSLRLEVTFVEENGVWLGRTYDRHTVAITDLSVLPHELLHVHYWRRDGDPDRNHEGPGGPWTEEDNETARSIRVALGI